jgi:succinate dehydrogenase (ubiquinone) cytochrome b560 subunit
VPVAKAVVAFPFVYHYCNGARHIYWDATAKGLDLQSVEQSSKLVIGGAVLGTILLAGTTI